MATSRVLQRLYSFDISSPDFLRNLHCLIQHDEQEQYLTSLRGSELTRLVDFLDEVRSLRLAFFFSYETASVGPQCYPHNRWCCTRVSKQTTIHL